jgi:hypothetical protein
MNNELLLKVDRKPTVLDDILDTIGVEFAPTHGDWICDCGYVGVLGETCPNCEPFSFINNSGDFEWL